MLLWIIFVIVVLIEAFVLYQGLSTAVGQAQREDEEPQTSSIVDLPAYEETLELIESREEFTIPNFRIQQGGLGRENPFLE